LDQPEAKTAEKRLLSSSIKSAADLMVEMVVLQQLFGSRRALFWCCVKETWRLKS
jgi:hypothetical protein